MSGDVEAWILIAVLVICRVGAFLAVAPFLSAARVSPSIRVFVALALSLALTPLLHSAIAPKVATLADATLLSAMVGEILTGLVLGFLVRLFFLAFGFAGMYVASLVGFMGMLGPSIESDEATTAFADLMTMFAAVLFFVTGLHLVVIGAILDSFQGIPVAEGLSAIESIERVAETARVAFLLALQLSAPFIMYAVVCNVLLGLANRLVPQVPIQLVAAPMIVFGGLMLGYLVTAITIESFLDAVGRWLAAQ